jgi:hypothetical protein
LRTAAALTIGALLIGVVEVVLARRRVSEVSEVSEPDPAA